MIVFIFALLFISLVWNIRQYAELKHQDEVIDRLRSILYAEASSKSLYEAAEYAVDVEDRHV